MIDKLSRDSSSKRGITHFSRFRARAEAIPSKIPFKIEFEKCRITKLTMEVSAAAARDGSKALFEGYEC